MDYVKKFLLKFKDKKNITSLIIFFISIILLSFNSTLNLTFKFSPSNAERESDNATLNVTYITPYEAAYDFNNPATINFNSNTKEYKIHINAESIKKIMLKFNNLDNNTTFSIESASIDTIYLPKIYFNIDGLKNHYNNAILYDQNYKIELNNISRVLVVIPILIFMAGFIAFIYIFKKEIIKLYKTILSLSSSGLIFVVGIAVFIVFYENIRHDSLKPYLSSAYINFDNYLVLLQFLKYDALMIFLFLVLFFIMIKVKSKIVSYTSLFFLFTLIILFYMDTFLRMAFDTRLNLFFLTSEKALIPDTDSLWAIISSFISNNIFFKLLGLIIYTILFTTFIFKNKHKYIITKFQNYFLITFIIVIIPFYFVNDFIKFFFGDKTYIDFISVNTLDTYSKDYSNNFKNQYKDYSLNFKCYEGLNSKKNIMVIFIESLSSYKSQYFGNVGNNLTPNIDKLAKDNINIIEYYSSGANSSVSIMGCLTGRHYISSKNDMLLKESLYNDSIPANFAKNGYKTILYSGNDTTFGSVALMAKNSGIKEIYDTVYNSVFLNEDKKYVFNGVDDSVLYNSIINWYKKDENKKLPFFMLVTTVTTHQPYIDPVTKTNSYDKTLKFADNAINDFINKLKEENYFENGILVITGDHRAMLPISKEEYEKLGDIANGRLPLVIIDGGKKLSIKGNYSHTDLGKSLEYLTLEKVCFNDFQNNIFLDENKEKCTIFQGSLDVSIVDVKCGNNYGKIKLDGDKTRFLDDSKIDKENMKKILDYINFTRISK